MINRYWIIRLIHYHRRRQHHHRRRRHRHRHPHPHPPPPPPHHHHHRRHHHQCWSWSHSNINIHPSKWWVVKRPIQTSITEELIVSTNSMHWASYESMAIFKGRRARIWPGWDLGWNLRLVRYEKSPQSVVSEGIEFWTPSRFPMSFIVW